MKCVVVMFDSLNRHLLPPYGCDWTHAPNFARLARRAATFDTSYVCSMPCMPARRDLHTGRPNFLHRSWGPLEPFDDSCFHLLKKAGIYSHLVTDHYHYWEDGGATYHNRYSSYEFVRGQEGDAWKGAVPPPLHEPDPFAASPKAIGRNAHQDAWTRQDRVNRSYARTEADTPQAQTFRLGLEFLEANRNADNWLLQIETFDPHEPFFADRRWKDRYRGRDGYDPEALDFDWPAYRPIEPENGETTEAVSHLRHQYAALLSQCDAHLGDVLDAFDRYDLWNDTLLIVWTDHGFLLGEHDAWAKIWIPFYEEIAHTPFFVWDPRTPQAAGQRRKALVQPSIDLAPTLLGFFKQEPTLDMRGFDLAPVVKNDTPVREAALFGVHGRQVNVTDGRYVYMRGPIDPANNGPLFDYTLLPTQMRSPFPVERLQSASLASPPSFPFVKGCPLLKIPALGWGSTGGIMERDKTLLWDVENDPTQANPLQDSTMEARMIEHLRRLLHEYDAPDEQYERLGLNG